LDPAELRTRNVVSLTPGLTWQKRDSFFRPHEGFFVNPSVTVSAGLDGDLDDFIKVNLKSARYWTPLSWCTVAASFSAGKAYFYGNTTTLPTDEKYYLGGSDNVRGFAKDALLFELVGGRIRELGGDSSLNGSFELRISPFSSALTFEAFEIPVFLDYGFVGPDLFSLSFNEIRESWGTGLRYHTAVGPISLLYARPLDPREGEATYRIHLMIGYTF
jgi:outer membrane protein insertion porin family